MSKYLYRNIIKINSYQSFNPDAIKDKNQKRQNVTIFTCMYKNNIRNYLFENFQIFAIYRFISLQYFIITFLHSLYVDLLILYRLKKNYFIFFNFLIFFTLVKYIHL